MQRDIRSVCYVWELMDGSVGLSLNVCFGREGLNGVYRRNGVR